MTIIMAYKSVILITEYCSPGPRLMVFENSGLREISGPNTDAVTGGYKKLYYEKLHNFYSSPGIIFFLSCGTTAHSVPRPPHCRGLTVARRHAIFGRTPVDD